MLLLTVSFSTAESPWHDAVASSYGHCVIGLSIFKSVVTTYTSACQKMHINIL